MRPAKPQTSPQKGALNDHRRLRQPGRPTVAGMAQALGLSAEAIDELFIVAAQIEA